MEIQITKVAHLEVVIAETAGNFTIYLSDDGVAADYSD